MRIYEIICNDTSLKTMVIYDNTATVEQEIAKAQETFDACGGVLTCTLLEG